MVKVIYYKLATTNLRPVSGPNGVEIVQIGAVCKHTRNKTTKKLNIYIIPNCRISRGATKVHGVSRRNLIKRERRNYNNVFHPSGGLQVFMQFLCDKREFDDERIFLVSFFLALKW